MTYTCKLANNLKLSNQLSYYDNNINYFGVYRRIGSAESKGFELEVNGNLLPGLDVTAGYTFSKAEILPYSSSEATNALAGKIVAFAPENLLNAWVNYEVQHGAIKGLSLSAGANYMDKTFTNSSHSYVLPEISFSRYGIVLIR